MKVEKKIGLLVAAFSVVVLLGTMCCAEETPQYGGTLRFVIGSPITTLAPGKSTASIADTINKGLIEQLVTRDMQGTFVPLLATSWSISDDGLVWTFQLRKGVKFHDGHELTAEDVKATFDRMLNPDYQLPLASVLQVISSVKIVDVYTVQLLTAAPVADMLPRLCWCHAGILSKDAVAQWGADLDWHPVGTGPYKFDGHVPEESVTLVRFDDYWGGRPYLDKVVFLTVREDATRVAMLLAGEADVIVDMPAADVQRLQATSGIHVALAPSTRVAHIGFNCLKPPFDNVLVREACNYAIDRDALVAGILKGVGAVSDSFVSPIVWGYYGVDEYSYQPDKARQLLAAAGYPNGFHATLATPQGRYFMDKETAVAVQDMLGAVGVQLDVKVVDWATYLSMLTTPRDKNEIELYLLGWESGTGDIGYLLDLLIDSAVWPPSGWNTMFYKNATVDALIAASRRLLNPVERYAVVSQIQELVVHDAPWIFLFVFQSPSASTTKVHGLQFLPTEAYSIDTVWLAK